MLYPYTSSDQKYEELALYIIRASERIAEECISPEQRKGYEVERADLAKRIQALVTEVRMTDREISLTAVQNWRKLPVIES